MSEAESVTPLNRTTACHLSEGSLQYLAAVRDELTLDLRGMADALWAMSYAGTNEVGMTNDMLGNGIQWVQRELSRKADHLEKVTHQVICEANGSTVRRPL